ncbi:hypothetical protein [Marinitenerispora sediminis]|nr:hypothetical protein [Marinitenerispora sediminis]
MGTQTVPAVRPVHREVAWLADRLAGDETRLVGTPPARELV